MDRGAKGQGVGSHDGSMVAAREPPRCAPQRAGSPEVGARPWRRSQPSAGGADRDRAVSGKTRRVVAGIDQKLGSCPRSRCGGRAGGDVAGAGSDDVSRVGTRTGHFPSAGRSTPFRSGALEGGEGASWRRMVSAGGVRADSEGGRGLGHDPLELGGHGRPDDAEQIVTSGRDFLPARRAGTFSFRLAGHPTPPPRQGAPLAEGLLRRWSAAAAL